MTIAVPPPPPPPDAARRIAELEEMLARALSVLGHDAREGHSSTLALLELQRVKAEPMTLEQFSERVEGNARAALRAIDDFTALARARTQSLRLDDLNLADLWVDAVADAWEAGQRRGVRVRVRQHPDDVPGRGDRDLLASAFGRLVRDALAATWRDQEIVCTLAPGSAGWCLDVDLPVAADAVRAAMDADDMPELARVVAQRHGGEAFVEITGSNRKTWRLTFSSSLFPVPDATA